MHPLGLWSHNFNFLSSKAVNSGTGNQATGPSTKPGAERMGGGGRVGIETQKEGQDTYLLACPDRESAPCGQPSGFPLPALEETAKPHTL